jgi:hypothetical protein
MVLEARRNTVRYFFADGDVQKGPFPVDSLLAQGLKPDSLVWREGMNQWQRADSVAELVGVLTAGAGYDATAGAGMAGPTGLVSTTAAPAAPEYSGATYPQAGQPLYPPAGAPVGLGYQQPGYYGTGFAPPAGMAIAAMVLGIVAIPMMCLDGIGTPCAIIGIILGHIARGKARRGEGGGAGMALAGLVCGYIALGILVVVILGIVGLFAVGAAQHH